MPVCVSMLLELFRMRLPHLFPSRMLAVLFLAITAFPSTLLRAAESPFRASALHVSNVSTPIGTDARPSFGWKPVFSGGKVASQSHYRIQVATSRDLLLLGKPDVWDSGQTKSTAVNAIPYGGPALKSDTRYFWRVLLTDQNGHTDMPMSLAYFDVGLLTPADWSGAVWIRRDNKEENDYTYYRKRFSVSKAPVSRAVLYITASHKYEAWLNGALVGKGPAYHQPQYQYYNAYDVTELVQGQSANTLAVFTRWWGAGQGRPAAARGLLAKLVIHHTDGSTDVVGTDASWKQSRAEQWELGTPKRNRTNGIGFIEKVHADKMQPGWESPGFDDSAWNPVTVIGAHPVAPWLGELQPDLTRVTEKEYAAISWQKQPEGHLLFDFGKVRPGYPVLDLPQTSESTTIELAGGYTLLPNGRINPLTNQKTDLSYVFHHDGKPRRFQAAEYLGMRYLEVKNLPPSVKPEALRFISRHYELGLLNAGAGATFSSSNPQLDRVWGFMVDSIPVCTQEQFIDTPTREKGGFLVDAWLESVAAMLVARDRTMTHRVLEEFLDSQEAFWSQEGALNDVYPFGSKEDIPDYTQAYLVWVWDYYLESGDLAFLRRHYGRLSKIMAYVLRSRNKDTGLIHELEGGKGDYLHGIIDWTKSMRYNYDVAVSANTVINAYAWLDLHVMEKIARTLDEETDAASYKQAASSLETAINRHLRNASGLYVDGLKKDGSASTHLSQQANMMPLAFGIVPRTDRTAVLEHVKSLRMSCGMVTVRWLVEAIGEMGDGDHLIELFTREDWDGWSKCLAKGATCTWESWNANEINESLSHAWGAIGIVGYVRYILGVSPLLPQHESMRIRPLIFGDKLTQASGRLPTERGDLFVSWKREAKRYVMDLEIPSTMSVEVWVPAAEKASLRSMGKEISARRDGKYLVTTLGPGKYNLSTQ